MLTFVNFSLAVSVPFEDWPLVPTGDWDLSLLLPPALDGSRAKPSVVALERWLDV